MKSLDPTVPEGGFTVLWYSDEELAGIIELLLQRTTENPLPRIVIFTDCVLHFLGLCLMASLFGQGGSGWNQSSLKGLPAFFRCAEIWFTRLREVLNVGLSIFMLHL